MRLTSNAFLRPGLLTAAALWLIAMSLNTRLGYSQTARLGSMHDVAISTELKTVKLYGTGGLGLDSYQSGFFISPEGHILTVWSTVLDADPIIASTSDGGRFEATVVGVDPNLEIAVLKANQPQEHYFALNDSPMAEVGMRVLALSNLYGIATGDERASVQKGTVMARTQLRARRGSFNSIYQGPVLVIDAMTNNPGAAGGALIGLNGKLLGILGKELRDAQSNIWMNYAIPVSEFKGSAEQLMAGKSVERAAASRKPADRPMSLEDLGFTLVPNILAKTPAFVDLVAPGSAAAKAGMQADDMILLVNSTRITSQNMLISELRYIDRADEVVLLVRRGSQLKELVIAP
jgi:S1-C subfamily serine protease